VRVDWYTSGGRAELPSWRCPERDFSRDHAPWSSEASWTVDARELGASVTERGKLPPSSMADPEAYVREGVLVSRMPDGALLRFAGDGKPLRGLALTVRGTFWIGRLEPAAGGLWSLRDGLIAGRVSVDELLDSVRQLGVCEEGAGAAQYARLAQAIMAHAEMLASGESKPERGCDALSFGIAVEAAQVTPGTAQRPLPALLACCEPGAQCEARCGDGKVSEGERCDTALARGAQGACPDACPSANPCTPSMLEGTGCDAHCEPHPIDAARAGDGCCPPGATTGSDSDCSAKCGNGIDRRAFAPNDGCCPPGGTPKDDADCR